MKVLILFTTLLFSISTSAKNDRGTIIKENSNKSISTKPKIRVKIIEKPSFNSFKSAFEIAKKNEHFFVFAYDKNECLYTYSLTSQKWDSINYTNNKSAIKTSLNLIGEKSLSDEDVIEIFQAYPLPFKMFSFRNLHSENNHTSVALDFFYINPNESSDVMETKWGPLLLDINNKQNSSNIKLIKPDSLYTLNDVETPLIPDFQYNQSLNDSIVLICLKPRFEKVNQLKRYFVKFNVFSQKLSDKPDEYFTLENANSFDEKLGINNPDKPIKYHKNGSLFFTENCPNFIYKNKEYDVQKILPSCSKILELKEHKNASKIEGIVLLNQQLTYVSFDPNKSKVDREIDLGNYEIKSNLIMDLNSIYFIDGMNRLLEIQVDF